MFNGWKAILSIDLFGLFNVVPYLANSMLRFFVYCICNIMWHSHVIWKFLKQNVLFTKGLNWEIGYTIELTE